VPRRLSGFSLNNLSLFGAWCLAIGNRRRRWRSSLSRTSSAIWRLGHEPERGVAPHDGTRSGGALIANRAGAFGGVHSGGVYIPGSSGQFFRQFRSDDRLGDDHLLPLLADFEPSRSCALLFKPHQEARCGAGIATDVAPIAAFFRGFNYTFDKVSLGYGEGDPAAVCGVAVLALVVYAGLIGPHRLAVRPRSELALIPNQDQGYLITVVQLAARRFARPHGTLCGAPHR